MKLNLKSLTGFFNAVAIQIQIPYSCVQELECLQDHLEDLVSACREVVGNLTELESEVFNIK